MPFATTQTLLGSLLILVAQLAFAQTTTANLPSFEFRGHTVGEPIEKDFSYWNLGYRGLNLPSCSKRAEGHVTCDDPTVRVPGRSYPEIGGVMIDLLQYDFVDGKFAGLMMAFHISKHSAIRAMLEGKYGKPSSEKVDTIQNRAGAKFDNQITEWAFREGALVLEQRSGRIDSSWLTFEDRAAMREVARRRDVSNAEKGKKAF